MLGFAVIRGKKIVVGSSLNHTPRACWPLVSKSKLWYEVTTSIKRSGDDNYIYAVAILKSGVVVGPFF